MTSHAWGKKRALWGGGTAQEGRLCQKGRSRNQPQQKLPGWRLGVKKKAKKTMGGKRTMGERREGGRTRFRVKRVFRKTKKGKRKRQVLKKKHG